MKSRDNPIWGRRIKKLRQLFRMPQRELAKSLGVSQRIISNWEKGDVDPSIAQLFGIAAIFSVDICYLLGQDSATRELNKTRRETAVKLGILKELTGDVLYKMAFSKPRMDVFDLLHTPEYEKFQAETYKMQDNIEPLFSDSEALSRREKFLAIWENKGLLPPQHKADEEI